HVVIRGGLTPAHVSPVSRAIVHRAEVTRERTASADKGGANIGVGKGGTAVSGSVDYVSAIGPATGKTAIAAVFVHASDVHVAVDLIDGDLDVSNKNGPGRDWKVHRRTPSNTIVTRAHDRDGRPGISKVVPGNVHSVGEGRGRVFVHHTRLAVVTGSAVNTGVMGPASRVPGSAGFVPAEATAALPITDPHGEPSGRGAIVKNNWVALSIGEGALTARCRKAVESHAAVCGDRCAGDVDGAGVAAA